MPPKEPRKKRAELPKPVVQPGHLGVTPLNALTASCLHAGQGELAIGFRDRAETLRLKATPRIGLENSRKKLDLGLDGQFFNGYADALYRGRLPEVMLAMPSPEDLPLLLEDFTDYLEQVLSMGFFLPKKELIQRDAVSELVPCTILTGSGLLFSRFVTGLLRFLRQSESQYPELNERTRIRLVGRFVRGLPTDADDYPARVQRRLDAGEYAPLQPALGCIRLAGGSRHTQTVIQDVLGRYGLVASVENRARNAVERLELENAMVRLSDVVLPALIAGKAFSGTEEEQELSTRVRQSVFSIGRRCAAFEETETLEKAFATAPGKPRADHALVSSDVTLLYDLQDYAEALGLTRESLLFGDLAEKAAVCCGKNEGK